MQKIQRYTTEYVKGFTQPIKNWCMDVDVAELETKNGQQEEAFQNLIKLHEDLRKENEWLRKEQKDANEICEIYFEIAESVNHTEFVRKFRDLKILQRKPE